MQTVSAMSSFIMHMMFHPDVQKKAQEEIDRVVGKARLPSVKDEAALPYVTAVLKEVLRATPVTALGSISSLTSTKGRHLITLV